jgi:hypothetical protein
MAKPAPTQRTDPALWEKVKKQWLRGDKGGLPGVWNARKAMLAVGEYKRRGGGYIGRRSPANSLKKWEREKWGYVDGDPDGRYLPERVRERLTPAEAKAENSRKRGRKGEWVPYTKGVLEKMRRAGVLKPTNVKAPAGEKAKPPARGKKKAPVSGKARAPASGKARTPAGGKARTPASGKKKAPVSGKARTPASGKARTPAGGKARTPAGGKAKAPANRESA